MLTFHYPNALRMRHAHQAYRLIMHLMYENVSAFYAHMSDSVLDDSLVLDSKTKVGIISVVKVCVCSESSALFLTYLFHTSLTLLTSIKGDFRHDQVWGFDEQF